MASELIEKNREGAEVYNGADLCMKKFWELMDSIGMPKGIVPLDDKVTELGHNKTTGFMWILRSEKKLDHMYKNLGGKVTFDTTVTAVLEEGKMKQVCGVKTKELFITFTISEIFIPDPSSGKITFVTAAGIKKVQPLASFQLEE